MKTLPNVPYLRNILDYSRIHIKDEDLESWLQTLGFEIHLESMDLLFPDSFTDKDMLLFKLKWS